MPTLARAKSLKHIQAISFDLDDTLWDNVPVIQKAISESTNYLNTQLPDNTTISQDELLAAYKAAVDQQPELAFKLTELRYVCYTLALKNKGLEESTAKQIASNATDIFMSLRQAVKPWPEAEKLLKTLSPHFTLAAITNGNCDVYQTSLGQYFSYYISPLEATAAKPSPEIYLYASQQMGIDESNILHIGDCETNDIQGAKNAGFKAAWFNPNRAKKATVADYEISHLDQIISLLFDN